MNRLNMLFTLSSINVLLVTVERFSFTTRVLLPGDVLRLHELLQMTALILFTVVLPFFLFREVSDGFALLRTRAGLLLAVAFVVGVYFYATGNGLHEVSSFNLNQFCDAQHPAGQPCRSFFLNDYYTGNGFYFFGGALMIVAILLMETLHPRVKFSRGDLALALANAAVYALAIFAYAAFDVALIGLIYAAVVMAFADVLYLLVRRQALRYPVVTYTAAAYTLGTLLALVVRLR
jgi:hypothetical protein